jgi:hypothetical protein
MKRNHGSNLIPDPPPNTFLFCFFRSLSRYFCCFADAYRIVHFDFFTLACCGLGLRTALRTHVSMRYGKRKENRGNRWKADLMASSNTLFKFRCVSAEHSRYLWALISFATIKAWSYDTGSILFALRLSSVAGSSRKSNFVPTRMMGTEGAW